MWFFFGLISALTDALRNVFTKHNTRQDDIMVVSWTWMASSSLFLLPFFIFRGVPPVDRTFWLTLGVVSVFDLISLTLFVQALKLSDISLTLPMLSFTPLFLLGTGFLINHEFPKPLGLIGVTCIVLGTYLLNFKDRHMRLYEPFMEMYKEKGTLMMLIVSFIWAFMGNLHKIAISHSNPYFYAWIETFVVAVLLTPLAYWSNRSDFRKVLHPNSWLRIIPVGFFDATSILSQMIAQSLSLVVFVISLKRMSIVFSSILGWLFFGEHIKTRIIPTIIMVFGVMLISFS